MWILIISLIGLALVAATAGIIRYRKLQKKIDRGELDAMPAVSYTHLSWVVSCVAVPPLAGTL